MTKNKNTILSVIILVILLVASYKLGVRDGKGNVTTKTITTTDTITKTIKYTIKVIQPQHIYSQQVRVDTITYTAYDTDTVQLPIPIEQRIYKDTNYTAYVSGYKPSLDSINIYNTTTTNTITTTSINTVVKNKKLSIGLQAGYGYGLKHKDLTPYVGIGIQYRF